MTAATPGPVENEPAGHGGDIDPVPVRDGPAGPQQILEQRPAAEIVDDELVFGERAVLEFARRLRLPQPAVAQKAARHRAVAEQHDAMRPGRASASPFSGRASSSEYWVCIDSSGTPASRMARVWGVSKLVPPDVHAPCRRGATRRATEWRRARREPRSPTSGTARGRGARPRAAAAIGPRWRPRRPWSGWPDGRDRARASCGPSGPWRPLRPAAPAGAPGRRRSVPRRPCRCRRSRRSSCRRRRRLRAPRARPPASPRHGRPPAANCRE